jgi:hypothetical protein
MPRETLLARTLVELADTLVADFDVVELLTLLTDGCIDVLDVGAAGLMLVAPDGDLRVMASSSEANPGRFKKAARRVVRHGWRVGVGGGSSRCGGRGRGLCGRGVRRGGDGAQPRSCRGVRCSLRGRCCGRGPFRRVPRRSFQCVALEGLWRAVSSLRRCPRVWHGVSQAGRVADLAAVGDVVGAGVAAEHDGSTWRAQPPVGSGGWVQCGVTFEQQSAPSALLEWRLDGGG